MKKGFTLIELLAVIIILGVVALIVAPIVNGTIEKSKVKAFTESMKNIIKSAQIYQADNNFIKLPTSGISIDSNIIKFENSEEFISGTIFETDGRIYLSNVSDGNYCGNGPLDALVITEGECTNSNACYTFDSATGTILSYNKETCPMDVVIPDLIGGVQVRNIAFGAFVEHDTVRCTTNDWYSEYTEPATYIPDDTEVCYFDITAGQNQITSVTFPRYLENIGPASFVGYNGANAITDLDFSLATNLISIGYDAFPENALSELSIENSANLDSIGDYSFCDNDFTFFYADGIVLLPTKFHDNAYESMLTDAFCTMYFYN